VILACDLMSIVWQTSAILRFMNNTRIWVELF